MNHKVIFCFVLFLLLVNGFSARSQPRDVPSITHDGIEYFPGNSPAALKLQKLKIKPHRVVPNGVYLFAVDKKAKIFEAILLYSIKRSKQLEQDVQYVFIESIEFDEAKKNIICVSERGDEFIVNIATKKSSPSNFVYDYSHWDKSEVIDYKPFIICFLVFALLFLIFRNWFRSIDIVKGVAE